MQRVLIANRGEIACRIVRSCRRLGLEAAVVYSDADASALHVELSDAAFHIGPSQPAASYLNIPRILDAAREAGAHAVHPGYGFLAENPDFACAVQAAGLIWVGPTPDNIIAMGDKACARQLAQAAGVPVLPGSRSFGASELDGLELAAEDVGYPLLVKAAAGGGGIGMRIVHRVDDLQRAVHATQGIATRSFGNGSVYLERYISKARHVEIQVFGLGQCRAIHLWERDCSIQRRFQKIIEESPAPNLPPSVRNDMAASAVRLAASVDYRGAGTIEFLVDVDSNEFYFLEMNTRIQVEHPVTEMITGVDLVALQLHLAAGADLSHLHPDGAEAVGHALECRLYAENPDRMFLPTPGTISRLVLPPSDDVVRIDTGVREGDKVTAYYDPMIAKIIVRGHSRHESVGRMRAALRSIEIGGLTTNLKFLQRVIDSDPFLDGDIFTGFVDTYRPLLHGIAIG